MKREHTFNTVHRAKKARIKIKEYKERQVKKKKKKRLDQRDA